MNLKELMLLLFTGAYCCNINGMEQKESLITIEDYDGQEFKMKESVVREILPFYYEKMGETASEKISFNAATDKQLYTQERLEMLGTIYNDSYDEPTDSQQIRELYDIANCAGCKGKVLKRLCYWTRRLSRVDRDSTPSENDIEANNNNSYSIRELLEERFFTTLIKEYALIKRSEKPSKGKILDLSNHNISSLVGLKKLLSELNKGQQSSDITRIILNNNSIKELNLDGRVTRKLPQLRVVKIKNNGLKGFQAYALPEAFEKLSLKNNKLCQIPTLNIGSKVVINIEDNPLGMRAGYKARFRDHYWRNMILSWPTAVGMMYLFNLTKRFQRVPKNEFEEVVLSGRFDSANQILASGSIFGFGERYCAMPKFKFDKTRLYSGLVREFFIDWGNINYDVMTEIPHRIVSTMYGGYRYLVKSFFTKRKNQP